MRTEKFDLAVVGGGPAGSNTARMTKEFDEDLDVVLFERGEQPAANCAGGLGIPFYQHLGIEPPDHIMKSPINEVVLSSWNNEFSLRFDEIDTSSVDWYDGDIDKMGWIVDRQEWDNWQLEQASKAGADIRTKHSVGSLEQNGKVNLEVIDREENEEIDVQADYVALACGPTWDLAIDAGFNKEEIIPSDEHIHMGLQYHMKDPEYFENYGWDVIYLLFDRRYAPKGYVWSFPEGKGYTRWGNGVPLSEDKNASQCLNRFFEDTGKDEYVETSRQKTNAIIPTAKPLSTTVNGKVALVGDTGHHCDPLHGGGMMFGARAGKQLAKSVTEGNINKYDKYWKDDFLSTLNHRFVIRDLIYNMNNEEYDRLVNAFKGFTVESLNPDTEIPRLLWHALKKDKGIFTKSAAQATRSFVRHKLGVS